MLQLKRSVILSFFIVSYISLYNLNARSNNFVEFYIPNILAFFLFSVINYLSIEFSKFLNVFSLGLVDYLYLVLLLKEAETLSLPFALINTNIYNVIWFSLINFDHKNYFFLVGIVIFSISFNYFEFLSNTLSYDITFYQMVKFSFILLYNWIVYIFRKDLYITERALSILICLIANAYFDFERFKLELKNFIQTIFIYKSYNFYLRIFYIIIVFLLFQKNNFNISFVLIYNIQILLLFIILFYCLNYDHFTLWNYAEYRLKSYFTLVQTSILLLFLFFYFAKVNTNLVLNILKVIFI